jgi:lipopolysaccharide/colanic/teichoic acid biosynthesis glycosyltransferase
MAAQKAAIFFNIFFKIQLGILFAVLKMVFSLWYKLRLKGTLFTQNRQSKKNHNIGIFFDLLFSIPVTMQ